MEDEDEKRWCNGCRDEDIDCCMKVVEVKVEVENERWRWRWRWMWKKLAQVRS